MAAFAGCTGKNEKTISSPNGDINVVEGSGPNWCKTGSTMIQTGPNGEKVTFEIKGIVNYEGKEVCQSGYTSNDGGMTIYVNEDSSYYVMIIKDKTGKETKIDMSQPKK